MAENSAFTRMLSSRTRLDTSAIRSARNCTALQGHRRESGEFNGFAVEHRQCAWQPQAHGTHVGVRRFAKTRGAGAEDLRLCQQLNMDFESDDRFVLGTDVRR